MQLTLISVAIAFAVGWGGAWTVQQKRILYAENNRLEVAQESERLVSRLESQRSDQVLAAQNNRAHRESKLRLDAAASSAVVTGMRNALAATVQAARTDPIACAESTSTLSVVFTDLSESYSELAATCDRHVSDIQALIESQRTSEIVPQH